MTTIDEAMELLHQKGWSIGDAAYVLDGERYWLVFCQRNGEQISVTASTSNEAWERAAIAAKDRDH